MQFASQAVVCIGEAMGQFVPTDAAGLLHSETFELFTAGAESNVAMAFAGLGGSARFASRLGDDPVGRRVLRDIERAGVDTELVEIATSGTTGIFIKNVSPTGTTIHYYRRGSAASELDRADMAAVLATRPQWIHLTGVTPALSASCLDATSFVLSEARLAGVITSFDINFRPALWASKAEAAAILAELADAADIVFVGQDEAADLWGTLDAAAVRAALPSPSIVVVKDGARIATSIARDAGGAAGGRDAGVVIEPAQVVDVVEPVGAGDAFAAGWIYAAQSGFDPSRCLRFGHAMAAGAIGSRSDRGASTPSGEELARMIA